MTNHHLVETGVVHMNHVVFQSHVVQPHHVDTVRDLSIHWESTVNPCCAQAVAAFAISLTLVQSPGKI